MTDAHSAGGDPAGGDSAGDGGDVYDRSGYELARAALEEARAAARAAGKPVGKGRAGPSSTIRIGGRSRRTWSGARPDSRDPQRLGRIAGKVVRERGWEPKISEGTLFGMWPSIVGEDIASHATPTMLRENVLHVRAESTAWATQLRYLQAQILAKIAAAIGDSAVTSLRIIGPQAPSWRKGPRHVSGRGPRDTYG